MKILVIIPAFNEEKNIKKTCVNLTKIKNKIKHQLDYIVINDCSSDKTKKVCEENNIPVINLIQNLGIGGAVQTGYKYALKNNYDIAIQFDGDGQHDAEFIEELIKPIIKDKINMTIGSRYISDLSKFKSTKIRQVGIKLLSNILKFTTGKKIYDVTSGFRAVDNQTIKIFANDYPNDYPEPETIAAIIKKGYKVEEVPVQMHEREYGESSITPFKCMYYMLKVSFSILMRSIIERREK